MKLKAEDFKILSRETAYKSQKNQVDRCTVLLPNGNQAPWDVNVLPNMMTGVTVIGDKVIMTKEYRLSVQDLLTQFTGARCVGTDEAENLKHLQRELKEELGIEGGRYEKLFSFATGSHTAGYRTVYLVTNFTIGDTQRDENELQDIITIPIKGLFQELSQNHIVTSDTLLIAKLLEEKYS
jgi:hypothetical protein